MDGGVERESSMNGHGSCRGPILSGTEALRENSETNAYGLSLCRGVEGGNRFEDHHGDVPSRRLPAPPRLPRQVFMITLIFPTRPPTFLLLPPRVQRPEQPGEE